MSNAISIDHTAASSQHQQFPSAYSQYNDPYSAGSPPPQTQGGFNADTYNQLGALAAPVPQRQASPPQAQTYGSPYAPNAGHQPEKSYTLGGGGYDAFSDPYYAQSHTQSPSSSMPMPNVATAITTDMPSPGRSPTMAGYSPTHARVQSPPQGQPAYAQAPSQQSHYDDSPPGYDAGPNGPAVPVPEWGSKGR